MSSPILQVLVKSQLILLLLLCALAYLISYQNGSCIQVPIFANTSAFAKNFQPDKWSASRALFLSNNSGSNHRTEAAFCIINEHCLIEVYNFDVQSLLSVDKTWLKSINVFIFDQIPCDSIRSIIQGRIRGQAISLKVRDERNEKSNTKLNIDFGENQCCNDL